jgi:formylglycine-generating enzyme required for sulfatase activity
MRIGSLSTAVALFLACGESGTVAAPDGAGVDVTATPEAPTVDASKIADAGRPDIGGGSPDGSVTPPDFGPEHFAALDDPETPCFEMGASDNALASPVHEVCLAPFALARTEVTNAEFSLCVRAGACDPPHYDDGTCYAYASGSWDLRPAGEEVQAADHPVVCIEWDQAAAYAAFVGARLPSEAEWEFAARGGGGDVIYPWGDTYPDCAFVVMSERGTPCEASLTAPPCSRPAGNTPQGACDLAGNVWEWVQDVWQPDYVDAPRDGTARETGDPAVRVVRGGGWPMSNADYFRARYRDDEPASFRYDFLGFRIARDE